MGGAVQSVAPILIPIVAVAASVIGGPEIGAAILGYGDTIEAVAAGYSVTTLSAVGAASIGAASGAISEAQKTGDPGKILQAAGVGAVGGAAGSEIGSTVGEATSDLGPTASNLAKATASGAASPFIKDELSGTNLQTATKAAELGGATGALTSGLSQATGATPGETSALGSAIGTALNYSNVFGTQPTLSSQVGSAPQGSTTLTGQAGAPTAAGSTVLGSALGFGSDPSAPVQTTEGGTSRSNVWNQASLRNPDQSGGSNV